MLLLKRLLSFRRSPLHLNDENKRKYHLIQAISLELVLINTLFIALSISINFNYIAYLLLTNAICVGINLLLLKKIRNLLLAGHVVNILCLIVVITGNLWFGGASTSTLDWFYIPPIIATVTLGLEGLLLYGALSGMILLLILASNTMPLYSLPTYTLNFIAHINPLFIFLLVCTILYHLLVENQRYENLLKDQNFILTADKKKFHYLSYHDSLTNLPNRSYFYSRLHEAIENAKNEHSAITLYFMDLDGFKKINDRFGHETGDILLLQVSKRLQACFRDGDFIARLGGDEFTAIIAHPLEDNISSALAERLKKEFKEPFMIKDQKLKCTLSIGKANYPLETDNAQMLLKIADESMYKKKRHKQKAELS